MNITQARKREIINDCIYFEYKHNIQIIEKARKKLLEEKGEEEYKNKFLKSRKINNLGEKNISNINLFPSTLPRKLSSMSINSALNHSISIDQGNDINFTLMNRSFSNLDSSMVSLNIDPKDVMSSIEDFTPSAHSMENIEDDKIEEIAPIKDRKLSVEDTGPTRTLDQNGNIKVINRKVWMPTGASGI